jgi:predicted DNA-binding transcriptional regulator AlpA
MHSLINGEPREEPLMGLNLAELQDAAAEAVQKYLTTPEVAELCRAAPETVRYWRHVGYGPRSFKVGRRVLYEAQDVRAWLASLKAEQQAG